MPFDQPNDYQLSLNVITGLNDILLHNTPLVEMMNADKCVNRLNNMRNALIEKKNVSLIDHIIKQIKPLYEEIKRYDSINTHRISLNPEAKLHVQDIFDRMTSATDKWDKHIAQNNIYNSSEYYEEQIASIKSENETLVERIKNTKEELDKKVIAFTEYQRKTQDFEQKLNKQNALIDSLIEEKNRNTKINNAIEEWNKKIKDAFGALKEHISPIKNEHKRLTKLFWGYLITSSFFVICVVAIEVLICMKIGESAGRYPTIEEYLSIILPIPISLGLLWGFITQMNRAQRQMVILTKQIYEIEYIEGLLLATNILSTDTNESMNKINTAIKKLLDNHLNYNIEPLHDETALKKEEKKDAMPYEQVLKLVKEVAGVVSKNKEG